MPSPAIVPQHRDAVLAAGLLALAALLLFLLSGRSVDLLGSPARIGLVLAWTPVVVAFWLSRSPWLVVAYLVFAGLLLRWVDLPAGGAGGSDVLAGTAEAIGVVLAGGNPYDHYYQQVRPPGQPMPYPPGALLVHLPGYLVSGLAGVQFTQFLLAGVAMGVFAWLGSSVSWIAALPSLAVYAGAPNLVNLATDGSNDTGVGAVLLAAVVALMWAVERGPDERGLIVSGLAGGVAAGMKQTAAAIVILLGVYLLRRYGWRSASTYAASAAAVLLVISLPFIAQGPLTYIGGLLSFFGVHDDIYGWNIWTFAQSVGWPVWDKGPANVLTLVAAAAALAVAVVMPYRTVGGALLAGLAVTMVVLLAARWTTYAYFALVAPPALALASVAWWDAQRARQTEGALT